MSEEPPTPGPGLNPDFNLSRYIQELQPSPQEAIEIEAVKAANRLDSQLKIAETEATRDPLTGLLNRRGLEEQYRALFAHPERHRRTDPPTNEVQEHAFVLFDLDNFKFANDEHGHPVGDRVLQVIAAALKDLTRYTDILARIGGDELAVFMPNTDQAMAQAALERLRLLVENFNAIDEDNKPLQLGLSAGITQADADFEATYKRADSAEQSAKRGGKNQIVIYQPPEI